MKSNLTDSAVLECDLPANPSAAREACPVCFAAGAEVWLRAPDRFHGRREIYTLLRCPACSLVWLDHPPQPDAMGAHYTDAYDRLISAAGQNSPHRWRDRNAVLSLHKTAGSLLDMGCSSGAFLETLRGPSWNLSGIEMSAESATLARERTGADIFNGTILEAAFAPGSFDVVTCFDVLEHLYEPRRVMARVAEWLKPGGIFYVLVPNIDSAEGRVFRSYWHGLELPRHLFHYSPSSLTALAQGAGLDPVSVETHRNPAVGTSVRYVWHDLLGSVGIRKTAVAWRRDARLPWRAARKAVRMTILSGLLAMAPLVGGGESIHAVFRKPDSPQ
ncbi:MAG: class I SAM-dependent methyltransferase [Acidobacteriaceae bacterium]